MFREIKHGFPKNFHKTDKNREVAARNGSIIPKDPTTYRHESIRTMGAQMTEAETLD